MNSERLRIEIPIDPFYVSVLVYIKYTSQEINKELEELTGEYKEIFDKNDEIEDGITDIQGKYAIILLRDTPNDPQSINTLSHEAFHAVIRIADRIGMELQIDKSEEFYAYLTGYIIEKTLTAIQDNNKPRESFLEQLDALKFYNDTQEQATRLINGL